MVKSTGLYTEHPKSVFFERLTPPIEVDTPLGRGWAIFLRDYGYDHDDLWTVLISATRQFWTFRNQDIRGVKNYTFGVGVKANDEPRG